MKNFKKLVALCSALAISMSIGVSAMAEVTTTVDTDGDFTVTVNEETYDFVSATGTGAADMQYTVLVAPKEAADAGNLTNADIYYINQGEADETFWANMGLTTALVDTDTTDEDPTDYVVRVGGTDITNGTKAYYEVTISVLTTEENTGITVDLGDANQYGGVEILDVLAILDHLSGIEGATLTGINAFAANANQYNGIEILDVLAVLDHLSGIEGAELGTATYTE